MSESTNYIPIIVSFLGGGLAGSLFNNLYTNHKNKIQLLNCYYIEDEVISKIPVTFQEQTHNNLQSKKFKIKNTTNKDINEMKVVFAFEQNAIITNFKSFSKAGQDIPRGKIYNKKNEIAFVIKHFNRNDIIEVELEISNIKEEILNITEMNITGIKINFIDQRKPNTKKPVKIVQKREL